MNAFVDIDYAQVFKNGQMIGGDVCLLSRRESDKRILCTLSDGLGSGVKANVLANLTATMAQKYMLSSIDIRRSAGIIMNTLPVCSERKISYSTFTLLDVSQKGVVRIVEYDNPGCLLFRNNTYTRIDMDSFDLPERIAFKKDIIRYGTIELKLGDRLIIFSDGVSQSGMGSTSFPLGWRRPDIISFIENILRKEPQVSSRRLAGLITGEALKNDIYRAKDDITCSVVNYRHPRNTLVASGPPFDPASDKVLTDRISSFAGNTIIAGGTTASIVARESKKSLTVDMKTRTREIPPSARLDGVTLVTEGMLTLSHCASLIEERDETMINKGQDAASRLARLLLESDRVQFLVGTKINEAHQNPDMPIDLGIRRTLVKRLIRALEQNYVKETTLEYI